jgi:hypothetical protein
MRTTRWLSGGLLLSAALQLQASPAHADMLGGLGEWRGSGTRFGADGRPTGDFSVELTRTAAGPGSVQTRGKITLATGQVVPFEQRQTRSASGFVYEAGQSKGKGFCFDDQLCYSHEDKGNGKTSATTMIIDGPSRVRILVTEYENGEPVQFLRQALDRK